MNERIYLDYNASTPIAPEVRAAMLPLLDTAYGNPSNPHWAAVPAHDALEAARLQVAGLLGASPAEVVFTSGGTEASNMAIKGAFFAEPRRGNHIIISSVEHPATVEPCRFLKRLGAEISVVPVDGYGQVDPDDVRRAITPQTVLISIMHANNEVGSLQPIAEIAAIAREHGILSHADAAQSAGKVSVDVGELGVDLLSLAGHKLYAPKGVGALFIRKGVVLEPALHGAGHEGGRRPGTESALLTTGLGAACRLVRSDLPNARLAHLRDRLWALLAEGLGDDVVLNGHPSERLPNTLNVSFLGHVGAELLARLPEIAASTGSACHAGETRISPVLAAMGVSPRVGAGAVRLSLGRMTTEAEIERAADLLVAAVAGASVTL